MTSGKTIEKDYEHKYKDQIESLRNLVNTVKQTIFEIADDLEKKEKVPLNQISTITTKILKGIVSRRYINECLDEKYKNTTRSKNARQQNKNKSSHIKKELDLAEVVPLNQDENGKEVISVVNDDQITFESTDNEIRVNPKDISMIDTDIVNSSPLQSFDKLGENLEDSNKDAIITTQQEEIRQLREALRKSIQFKTVTNPARASENKNKIEGRFIEGEFSMIFDKMQKYLDNLYPKIGSNGNVWLKFKYDFDRKEVIYADFGRLNQDDNNEESTVDRE